MERKYKVKALALVCLNVLSCTTMFVSVTAAWFTTVKSAEAAAQIFKTQSDDRLDVSFEIYDYDLDNMTGKVATDSITKDDKGRDVFVSKFALPQYDSFIPERNTYNNKILRIEILSKTNIDSTSKFSLNIPCSGSFLDGESNVTRNMSNIIGFKYFFKHELPNPASLNESSPGSIYAGAYSVFNGIEESRSYVTINDEPNGSKTGGKIQENAILFDELDLDENASDAVTVMYLEYFYKEDLVDYYFDHSTDKKATADDLASYSVSFACDIVKLQFNVGGND